MKRIVSYIIWINRRKKERYLCSWYIEAAVGWSLLEATNAILAILFHRRVGQVMYKRN